MVSMRINFRFVGRGSVVSSSLRSLSLLSFFFVLLSVSCPSFSPLATYFHGRIKRETIHSQCWALLFHTRFLFLSTLAEVTCVVMTHLCRPSRVLHAERSEGIYTVRHSAEFRKNTTKQETWTWPYTRMRRKTAMFASLLSRGGNAA